MSDAAQRLGLATLADLGFGDVKQLRRKDPHHGHGAVGKQPPHEAATIYCRCGAVGTGADFIEAGMDLKTKPVGPMSEKRGNE